jgi:hypothetical protein
VRHVGVILGGASGAAVVLGGYEVLRAQPGPAFGLLQAWGPWFLIVMLAIVLLGRFLDGLNATVRESFAGVVAGMQGSAAAAGRTADALTALAAQGSHQSEEVRRLAIYAAREFPAIYDRFDQIDAAIQSVAQSVRALHGGNGEGGNERRT